LGSLKEKPKVKFVLICANMEVVQKNNVAMKIDFNNFVVIKFKFRVNF